MLRPGQWLCSALNGDNHIDLGLVIDQGIDAAQQVLMRNRFRLNTRRSSNLNPQRLG